MNYGIPTVLRRDYRKQPIMPDIEGGKTNYRATKLEIVLGMLVVLFALGFVWVGNLYIDLALGV